MFEGEIRGTQPKKIFADLLLAILRENFFFFSEVWECGVREQTVCANLVKGALD